MPLMRYFVFVGGALLALLFIANACLPALPATEARSAAAAADLSVIRIHSNTKWPERVVFDTSRPTITPVPAPVMAEAAPVPEPAKAATPPLKTGVREAFAQVQTIPAHVEPKRKRKTIARNYGYGGQQRIVVAQQRPAFFGAGLW